MKKIITTITIALIAITASTAAILNPNNGGVQDSETIAHLYMRSFTDHYVFDINAIQVTSNGQTQVMIRLTTDKQLVITNMAINNCTVPLPKPLLGIPIHEKGLRDVNVNAYGVDKTGMQTMYGYSYTNVLIAGDPISVTLQPMVPPSGLALSAEEMNGSTVEVEGADWGGWFIQDGQAYLQTGPYSIGARYTVYDGNGNIIRRGYIDPLRDQPSEETSSVLNVKIAGGVQEAIFGDSGYRWFGSQKFTGLTERDGAVVKAKVYTVPDLNRKRLIVQVNNLNGGSVTIKDPQTGNEIGTIKNVYDGGWVEYRTEDYLDSAMVTILPAPGVSDPDDFYISIQRY